MARILVIDDDELIRRTVQTMQLRSEKTRTPREHPAMDAVHPFAARYRAILPALIARPPRNPTPHGAPQLSL
jgi:hypothetical protein